MTKRKQIRRRSIAVIDENFETFVNTSIPNLFSNNEKDILEGKIELAKKIAKSTNKEGVKAAQLGMAERPDRTEILEKLEAKILIIAGKYDNAVKTENLLKYFLIKQILKLTFWIADIADIGKNQRFVQKLLTQSCCIICRRNWCFKISAKFVIPKESKFTFSRNLLRFLRNDKINVNFLVSLFSQ
jgi:hypothetical protein